MVNDILTLIQISSLIITLVVSIFLIVFNIYTEVEYILGDIRYIRYLKKDNKEV